MYIYVANFDADGDIKVLGRFRTRKWAQKACEEDVLKTQEILRRDGGTLYFCTWNITVDYI